MKCVTIYNGPPGSGKDLACQLMIRGKDQELNHHMMFKEKLLELTKSIYNLGLDSDLLFESRLMKEKPTSLLGGLSPRQALIKVSEEVIKPNFGKDYFGRALVKRIQFVSDQSDIFISDGGFWEELEPLMNMTGVYVNIVRLTKSGCSFDGDSRTYFPDHIDGVLVADIFNSGFNESFFRKQLSTQLFDFHEWVMNQ